MKLTEKIEMEQKQIKKFAKNAALSKKQKAFYIQMFRSNIQKYIKDYESNR